MPLVRNGETAHDSWTFVEDGALLPSTGCVTVSAHRLVEDGDALFLRNQSVGVRLAPEDDPASLTDVLDRLGLIEISFPKYTDGRGYSQAQLLRRRLGYGGELRAVGHVLRDQILYMHRSGFDAFETARADLPHVLEALAEFSAFYQIAADGKTPVFNRRG